MSSPVLSTTPTPIVVPSATVEPEPAVWLTDRSRMTEGVEHCGVSRLYHYHYKGGYGIESTRPSLDTTVGIAVHDMLATRLLDCSPEAVTRNEMLWRGRIGVVAARREETAHTTAEQAHLAIALAYGWWTVLEGWLKSNFTVAAVENEYQLSLGDGRISLQSRPDLVLRDKHSGKLTMPDFKTLGGYNAETTPATFRESVQMALQTAVVEEALGEAVPSYWIFGLVKGSRKHFERDGQKSPEKRVYSSLCYASEPLAPFGKLWTTKGYWLNKKPIWEHFSPHEWVDYLKKHEPGTLAEMFPAMGPFERQTHMIPQALRGVTGQEERWIAILGDLEKQGYSEEAVDAAIPRSYGHCTSYYGGECPYIRLCFKLPGHEDPIGSGYYKPRRPHHAAELAQLEATGAEIPKEPWE